MVAVIFFGTKYNKNYLNPIFLGFYSNINNADKGIKSFLEKNKDKFDETINKDKDFVFIETGVNEDIFFSLGNIPMLRE